MTQSPEDLVKATQTTPVAAHQEIVSAEMYNMFCLSDKVIDRAMMYAFDTSPVEFHNLSDDAVRSIIYGFVSGLRNMKALGMLR
jgi:hypothetical protein